MRLLLDECLPIRLRELLPGHDARTVAYMGWKGVRNGRLLATAAAAGFDALITSDGSIEYQQNMAALPLAIVALEAASNDLSDLEPLIPALLIKLVNLPACGVTRVSRFDPPTSSADASS